MRLVLDTCVVVSAARSRYGASRSIIDGVERGLYTLLLSHTLLTEYEAVLTRPEQMRVHRLSAGAIDDLLDNLVRQATQVTFTRRIRPQLPDPNDEHVLETAVNGAAEAIVTHNVRDFLVGALRFNIPVLTPGAILEQRRRR